VSDYGKLGSPERWLQPGDPGPSDPALATDPAFHRLVSESYRRYLRTPLGPAEWSAGRTAAWLYDDAPFCLLVHNTALDPRFVYVNRRAQACFEYSWDELTALPSRLSAEAPDREERQRLLDAVAAQGFASGYRGLRIAKSGRRFWIEDVTVWQLVDNAGAVLGQAAKYQQWRDA
jgi:hypothetical protein